MAKCMHEKAHLLGSRGQGDYRVAWFGCPDCRRVYQKRLLNVDFEKFKEACYGANANEAV